MTAHRTTSTKGTASIVARCTTCPASTESWGHDESSRNAIARWMKEHEATPPADYADKIAASTPLPATFHLGIAMEGPLMEEVVRYGAECARTAYALGHGAQSTVAVGL